MKDQSDRPKDLHSDPGHLVSGMSEGRKKAFELAADAAKQLLTLSTGVIAFSVTFLKDIFNIAAHKITPAGYCVLVSMWLFYLASAVAGILTLNWLAALALNDEPELVGSDAQNAGKWQMLLFAIALLLTVTFGALLAYSAAR